MALADERFDAWDSKMKDWLRPLTLEIGRTEAVHLAVPSVTSLEEWLDRKKPIEELVNVWKNPTCSTESWIGCEGIQFITPRYSTLTLAAASMVIAGIILVVLASRYIQESLVRYKTEAELLLFIVLITALGVSFLLAKANTLFSQGIGEPFLWLEGVSVWPSITIRFFWLSVTIIFILAFALKLMSKAQSISDDFGLGFPINLNFERKNINAIVTGPHVDLSQYDDEGKRYRIPENGTRAEGNLRTLWYNYLRVTSLRESSGWIVASAIVASLFAYPLFALFPPAFPYRGELVKPLYIILVLSNVLICGELFSGQAMRHAPARA
jgi:hypothetical protein